MPSQPQSAPVASTAKKAATVPAKSAPARAQATSRGQVAQPAPSRARILESTAAAPVVAAVATARAAQPAERAVAQEAAPAVPVTMTGCLEDDAGTYRLKNAIGADAPKSRSWKSAFLKKRSASIEVVDAANRLKLPTHVGQRVEVTGILEDREMRARALQRVGEPCD